MKGQSENGREWYIPPAMHTLTHAFVLSSNEPSAPCLRTSETCLDFLLLDHSRFIVVRVVR